jgi:hypothetical protein
MLEFIVGLGFAVSIGAAIAWVLLWLLRLRTTEVRGTPRPPGELSDDELRDLLGEDAEKPPDEER